MPDDSWKFEVERISLGAISINAQENLGMVVVQPMYEVKPDGDTPFQIEHEEKQAQSNLIEKTFRIRDSESRIWEVPIPFILFPEYSIPTSDPDGLSCLKEQMERVECDLVFIGGLEGLRTDQVSDLTSRFPPENELSFPDYRGDTFVNLCVIAVKTAGGRLSWHYQAKIAPSQWEHPRNMARGKRVLHFHADNIDFLCQICYDHIAALGPETLNEALFRKLNEQDNSAGLDYVFIPQYNDSTQDQVVRDNTKFLLNHEVGGLAVLSSAVVVINRAAENQQTKEYGRSGLHYKSGRWQVRKNDVGPMGYELFDRDKTTSAVFRKRTQSIHVATLIPPSMNVGEPNNPRQPLERVRSYLIDGACDPTPCSCLPGIECEADRFVDCHCLPCKLRDTLKTTLSENDDKKRWHHQDHEQSNSLKQGYDSVRSEFLKLRQDRARAIVELLLDSYAGKCGNPDIWTELECEAIIEMVSALSILAEHKPLSFDVESLWTVLLGKEINVVVADGADSRHTYTQMFREYFKQFGRQYSNPGNCKQRVLFVAVRSDGALEQFIERIQADYTRPRNPRIAGFKKTFERPLEPQFFICQGRLLDGARHAPTILRYLDEKMGCIYE